MSEGEAATDRWLTYKEVAEHLGVAKQTVYNWASQGKIPRHKRGRVVRFRRSEIDEWMEAGRIPAEESPEE